MAASQQFSFEEELCCAICLELFTDPVTIPCGHNFCMECIKSYWDKEVHMKSDSCPNCRASFPHKPHLCKNIALCEVVGKISKPAKMAPRESCLDPDDAECDFCIDQKVKATKSCLVCMASFCDMHIRPHHVNAALSHHKLVDAVKSMENRLCKRHNRPLELFCRTDETFICCVCIAQEHEEHISVTIDEERAKQQKKLAGKETTLEKHVEMTENEIGDLRKQTDLIKNSAITVQKGIAAKFKELVQDIENANIKVDEFIEKEKQTALIKSEDAITKKEQKCVELRMKKLQMGELSGINDDIKFLQEVKALNNEREKASTQVTCDMDISLDDLRTIVNSLKEQLKSKCTQIVESLDAEVAGLRQFWPKLPEPQNRMELLMYARQLTFDSKTAHKCLSLTEGNRKATNIWPEEVYEVGHSERFDCCWQVLCVEQLDKGAHYWEVEISEGSCLGVTYKTIKRKGPVNSCFVGKNDHSWGIQLYRSHCSAWHNNAEVRIKSEHYEQIGVYLNCSNGSLSFYGVTDTMTLIHKFQAVFTEPLYPAFRLINSQSFCYLSD
ncbi:tripartite motif-containing protein 16-like [Scyliorhinus canicula]|uniref:tripartite motif-containing protein 16-like n=1 Tax=Scyliorhinus canicula TaxID=7830 RepID=UPI0018F3F565|nr:tripartite motif-containing protein 16-like [Scyliorhinus canicula]